MFYTGTPQGSILGPTLFNMVINQLLQLNLGIKVQMITYADDLAIHGVAIGDNILYKQITTVQKKIETKAMQLGLKLSQTSVRPYGIEATTQTGISRSLEKRSHGEHQSNTSWVIMDKRLNLRNDGPYQHRHVTGLPESMETYYSGSTMRHKCQNDETQTSAFTRGTLCNAK